MNLAQVGIAVVLWILGPASSATAQPSRSGQNHSVASRVPSEAEVLRVCKRVRQTGPSAKDTTPPAPSTIGWFADLSNAPLTSSASVSCALDVVSYWDTIGIARGSKLYEGGYRVADNLLWGIVDTLVASDGPFPTAERVKALKLFGKAVLAERQPRARASFELAASEIAGPGTEALAISQRSQKLADITGLTVASVVKDPSLLLAWTEQHLADTEDQPAASGVNDRLSRALWSTVEQALELQFAGNAGGLFDGTPYGSGEPALRIAYIVQSLTAMPREVTEQFVINRMKADQIVKLSELDGEEHANAPMAYNATGSVYIGRCNSVPLNSAALATADHWQSSFACEYSPGTSGEASISYTSLFSEADAHGQRYYAEVASSAHGGCWGYGSENETATVSHHAEGHAAIPRCNDITVCAPFITIRYENLSQIGNDQGVDPTTTLTIAYKSVSDPDYVILPAGSAAVIDRSDGPVDLRASFGRNFSHKGACCEPPGVIQAFNLSVRTDSQPPGWFLGASWASGIVHFLEHPSSRPAAHTGGQWGGVGYLLANKQSFSDPTPFADRFSVYYLRMTLASQLETLGMPMLDAANVKTASLARIALSVTARNKFMETARESYRATRSVYTALPFSSLIKAINAAITELSQGRMPAGKDPLAEIQAIQDSFGPNLPGALAVAAKSTREALAARADSFHPESVGDSPTRA